MEHLPAPTPQGQAIIKAWTETDQSLMIIAYAGCGKTTMLRQLAPHIKQRRVLSLAFNKKNATDLAAVMPSHFECSTLNSIGHRALQRAISKRLNVQSGKMNDIIKEVGQAWGMQRVPEEVYQAVSSLYRQAKSIGLMPSTFSNFKTLVKDEPENWEAMCDELMLDYETDTVRFARECLIQSVHQTVKQGLIDYDDQIYMSVLAMGIYEKYEVVQVDEAQDLSPLNHLQLKKSLQLGGRYIVVGDPKQAIYAFRGASSQSMPEIENLLPEGRFTKLPLSLTFRCSKLVVERNQSHAPGFEAAPGNLPGELYDYRHKAVWGLKDIPDQRFTILCRNNAPLLAAAFRLIRNGKGVTMLGRDIGKQLSNLLARVCGSDKKAPIFDVVLRIEAWAKKERDLAIANGKEEKLARIEDQSESLLACAEGAGVDNLGQLEDRIISLFEDQGGLITLGTAHRAKGMEWHTVVHLDPWRIPSKFAQRAEEAGFPEVMQQELNLKYVLETRTKDVLILGSLDQFQP